MTSVLFIHDSISESIRTFVNPNCQLIENDVDYKTEYFKKTLSESTNIGFVLPVDNNFPFFRVYDSSHNRLQYPHDESTHMFYPCFDNGFFDFLDTIQLPIHIELIGSKPVDGMIRELTDIQSLYTHITFHYCIDKTRTTNTFSELNMVDLTSGLSDTIDLTTRYFTQEVLDENVQIYCEECDPEYRPQKEVVDPPDLSNYSSILFIQDLISEDVIRFIHLTCCVLKDNVNYSSDNFKQLKENTHIGFFLKSINRFTLFQYSDMNSTPLYYSHEGKDKMYTCFRNDFFDFLDSITVPVTIDFIGSKPVEELYDEIHAIQLLYPQIQFRYSIDEKNTNINLHEMNMKHVSDNTNTILDFTSIYFTSEILNSVYIELYETYETTTFIDVPIIDPPNINECVALLFVHTNVLKINKVVDACLSTTGIYFNHNKNNEFIFDIPEHIQHIGFMYHKTELFPFYSRENEIKPDSITTYFNEYFFQLLNSIKHNIIIDLFHVH